MKSCLAICGNFYLILCRCDIYCVVSTFMFMSVFVLQVVDYLDPIDEAVNSFMATSSIEQDIFSMFQVIN